MIAYIPARGGSKRIPHKNKKLLGGKPVIAHVIEAARSLAFVAKVCVSTDDPEIQSIAVAYGAETGDLRSKELSGDHVDFMTLIKEDVSRFAGESDDLLFILPTAVLVQAVHYKEAFGIYREKSPEILMATVEYPITPYWAMVQKSDGFLKPLHPEAIKTRSQDLPQTCVDAGLFYMMKWKKIQRYETLMADKLLPFPVSHKIAVDVDTLADWQRLESLYGLF